VYFDTTSGDLLDERLVKEARRVEISTFGKRGAREKRQIKESWEIAGTRPPGVKWVETHTGDKGITDNHECRCRLLAKMIEDGHEGGLVRGGAPPRWRPR
jgi:hypothetical protein